VLAIRAVKQTTGLPVIATMTFDKGPRGYFTMMGVTPQAAAEKLAEEGISVEVVDPRTLVPLDKQTILRSVAKTGRLVTVDMAHKTCSAASEIAAMVAMEGFWSLQAPIQRLGTANVHIPFSPALEPLVYPTPETIATAVKTTME